MFKVEIKQEKLKEIIDAIMTVNEEAIITFNESGLESQVVDPGHIMMGSISFGMNGFEVYDTDGEEIAINLKSLSEFVGMAPSGCIIQMKKNGNDNIIVRFSFMKRQMQLLDTQNINKPKMPNMNHTASSMPLLADIKLSLKGAKQISKDVKLGLTDKGLRLIGKGETDIFDALIAPDIMKEHKVNAPGKGKYNIESLGSLFKVIPENTTFEVFLGNDQPIKIEFTDDHLEGIFMLAPIIDDEEKQEEKKE